MRRTAVLASLAAVTALALALRLRGAGASGLWRDEAQCLAVAQLPSLARLLDFLRTAESHPPLYYLLLRALGGARAALGFSVVLGALAPALAFVLLRRDRPAPLALAGAGLLALCAPMVRYSDQVRPYSLLPLLSLLAVLGLRRLMAGEKSWSTVALYGLSLAAMLLTHHWSIVFWLAQNAAFLLTCRHRRAWLLGNALALALWSPWWPALWEQVRHAGHGPGQPSLLSIAAPLVAALLVVAALVLRRRIALLDDADRATVALLTIPLAGYLIVWSLLPLTDLTHGRCTLSLRMLAILGLVHLIGRTGRALRVVALAGAVALTGFWQLPRTVGTVRSNARELAAALARQSLPGDSFLVAPAVVAPSFALYLPEPARLTTLPPEARPAPVSYADLVARERDPASYVATRDRLLAALRTGRRVWLLTHYKNAYPDADPEQATVPPLPGHWAAGEWRAGQLRNALRRAAGHETIVRAGSDDIDQEEALVALRYDLPSGAHSAVLWGPEDRTNPDGQR